MGNLHSRYLKFCLLIFYNYFLYILLKIDGFMQYTLITNFHSPTPSKSSPSSTLFPYKNRKQNLKIIKANKGEYTDTHTHTHSHSERATVRKRQRQRTWRQKVRENETG